MAYINSSQIRVFPSVGRSNYDIESQLMNENNISQIVRSLCRERKSYVLSTKLSTGPFEFVIYGFYFKILDASNTLSSITSGEGTKEVWVGIKIDANAEANNTSSNYQLLQLANTTAQNNEIIDLDRENQFQGIIFGTKEDEVNGEQGENYHTLLLLTKDAESSAFKVPAKSLLHLNTTEILNGDSSDYISDKFTTKQLNVSESISDVGTLNVTGETTLSSNLTASGCTITASTFVGSLNGNATTATNFDSNRTFSFSDGDISGSASSNSGNYTITASIRNGAVTEAKIADNAVTTNKIKDSNITTSKIDNGAVTNDKIANETIKVEKLGFNLNMTLSVTGDDTEHKTLTISLPTLENK